MGHQKQQMMEAPPPQPGKEVLLKELHQNELAAKGEVSLAME
jgi:hypothetical protein